MNIQWWPEAFLASGLFLCGCSFRLLLEEISKTPEFHSSNPLREIEGIFIYQTEQIMSF